MNEFTMAHPDIVNYIVGGLFLGLFWLVIYTWKTSWKQQNAINERILHRLEALDKETDAKIERLSAEVRKADTIHESIRLNERDSLTRDNEITRALIDRLKDLTEKISKLEFQK